jgi:tetratricopeptide (TPR) repeat protein
MDYLECKKCGYKEIPSEMKDCPKCGIKLIQKNGHLKIIFSIILCLVFASFLVIGYQINKKRVLKQKEIEFQKNKIAEFNTNKIELLKNIRDLIDNKQFDSAKREIDYYNMEGIKNSLVEINKYFDEMKLYDEVKKIPSSNLEDSYRLYHELTLINPQKELYKEKESHYKFNFSERQYQDANSYFKEEGRSYRDYTEALKNINVAISLKPDEEKYNKLKTKLQKEGLSFYSGNHIVLMALREDPVHPYAFVSFNVGIKNISSHTFHVNPNHFTFICKDNHSHPYSSQVRLLVDLQPGTETDGWISFRINCPGQPRELIFESFSTGRISKIFP